MIFLLLPQIIQTGQASVIKISAVSWWAHGKQQLFEEILSNLNHNSQKKSCNCEKPSQLSQIPIKYFFTWWKWVYTILSFQPVEYGPPTDVMVLMVTVLVVMVMVPLGNHFDCGKLSSSSLSH